MSVAPLFVMKRSFCTQQLICQWTVFLPGCRQLREEAVPYPLSRLLLSRRLRAGAKRLDQILVLRRRHRCWTFTFCSDVRVAERSVAERMRPIESRYHTRLQEKPAAQRAACDSPRADIHQELASLLILQNLVSSTSATLARGMHALTSVSQAYLE